MSGKSIHVIHCGRDWEVKAEGEAAPFFSAEHKMPVVDYARRLAKEFHAELVVHDSEGSVEYREGVAGVQAERVQYSEAKTEYGDGPGQEPGESNVPTAAGN